MLAKERSPFNYGKTVEKTAFTNREKETEKLVSNLVGGVNTILISPRRWGKSSLVEKVISVINKKHKTVKTVVIDLFSVANEEEFLELYAKEVIKASSPKWKDWVTTGTEYFKQLVPKMSFGIDPNSEFTVGFDWKELKKHKLEVLELPEKIALKKNIQFVICLDEFQNLAEYSGYESLEKKMRSVWQRQKNVTYCLYGSKRHMMTEIFNDSSKPFYRFGDIMLLQKIEKSKWITFIVKGFRNSGKIIDKNFAGIIPEIMKNHSWYVQQLAHYTWRNADKETTMKNINNALEELIYANTPLYQKEVEILSKTQLSLVKAIIKEETKFTSARVMQQYHLGTPRNVLKNKATLIKNDIVHEENGKLELLDPAFVLWFKKQFFDVSFKLK
jgi:hypothetical protein